jgi:hypothetical protein
LFFLIAFSGVFQQVEFKNSQKLFFEKKSISKMFYKKMRKSPFRFFPYFFVSAWSRQLAAGALIAESQQKPKNESSSSSSASQNKLALHRVLTICRCGAFAAFAFATHSRVSQAGGQPEREAPS